jgi:predicted permease
MAWHRPWTLLRRLMRLRAQEDRDLDDELAFHIAEETRLRLERGASPTEAARAARRAFGNVTLAKEQTRGVWVSGATERLLQDLRFGFRILINAPLLLLSAVTLVALVIGGNTTVYSIARAILNKPAPGVRAENLVTVSWIRKDGFVEPETSYSNYQDLAAQSRSLGPMLAYQYVRVALGHENGSNGIWAAGVSANYFQALEVPIVIGRSFTADEDQRATSGLPMVISDRAWREYFAAAPSAVGAAVLISGLPAIIVGVAAPDFRGTLLAPSVDAWVPIVPFARAAGGADAFASRQSNAGVRGPLVGNFVGVLAQLQNGSSLTKARTELATLWERLQSRYADVSQDTAVAVLKYSATAGGNSLLSSQGTTFLAIFSVITGLTLVIVCANVANLLLGRATARQRELALRQSLGASPTRLVRMLIAEGLVIALLAGAAAYVFTRWMTGVIANLIALMVPPAVSQVIAVPDWGVAAYAMLLALISLAIFSLAPAARAWRLPLLPSLKAGELGVVQGRSRLSSGLVVVQLALAVLLITSAGLVTRSIVVFAAADLGFDSRSILLVTVNTNGAAADQQTSANLIERLRARLQTLPGIESVSYSSRGIREDVRAQTRQTGAGDSVGAEVNLVGPDYLRTHGLAPIAGRELAVEKGAAATPAIVTQGLAERLWPGQPAIGRRLFYGRQREREAEIVGVAPNVLFNGNRVSGNSYVLLPASADPRDPGERTLYLRYSGRLEAVAPAIGQTIRTEDSRVPVVSLRTLDGQLQTDFWPVRALTTLLAAFAVVSLIIAIIGQYAVVAFDMRRRIRDFGVRIALGASSRQILLSVLKDGLKLTAIGLVIGFGLSVLTGTGLSRVLYGITPTDPVTYGGVLLLLALASLAACSLPAVRASRVNPISTLRQE